MSEANNAQNTLCKRIIPCLDVDSNGRTVKGVQFQSLRDIGDPVEMALYYQNQGADELVFLDISASHEGRETLLHLIERIADVLMIPFTVGGGIRTLDDALLMLKHGADKVSINSAAVKRPQLIQEIAQHCGSQCCVLAIDARQSATGAGWDVLIQGGRETTGKEAVAWAQEAVALGAGEILLTSWDKDGTQSGFDLPLTQAVSRAVSVPVIASGGAAGASCFYDVFTEGLADAALAASIFHDGRVSVAELKHTLQAQGIAQRIV